MATISNESVSLGDKVYDVAQGQGEVISLMMDDITVKFKNGRRITYDKTGHYAGIRRLYWHNPVIIEPSKNKIMWDTIQNILYTFLKFLEQSKDEMLSFVEKEEEQEEENAEKTD